MSVDQAPSQPGLIFTLPGNTRKVEGRRSDAPTVAALKRLMRTPSAVVSMSVMLIVIALAVLASVVAPYDPLAMGTGDPLAGPSAAHWFGTDLFGRDILSRTIYGGRLSLMFGFAAVLISSTFGVVLGLLAGYYGGWPDMVISRTMDMILAFPGMFLALAIVALLGPSLVNAVLAVAVSSIPNYTRTVRGCVLATKECLYIDAARVIGVPDRQIVFRHLLPNVLAPVIILMTLGIAWAILSICSLSFLGLGAQPPTPEWGILLFEGRGYLREAWWLTAFPGMAIMITVMAVNRLGDGLRDALDPRLKL
jgi:peptide/nickel transport system permease protein